MDIHHAALAQLTVEAAAIGEGTRQAFCGRHSSIATDITQRVGTGTATTSSPSIPPKSSGLHVCTGSAHASAVAAIMASYDPGRGLAPRLPERRGHSSERSCGGVERQRIEV